MAALKTAMAVLPKNLLSYLAGIIVRVRVPRPFSAWLCRGFVKLFKIDMTDAEKPIGQYSTIEEVFTRRLRKDARAVSGPLCSPADGYLSCSLPADGDQALQAKGQSYSISDMIFGQTPKSSGFKPSWYICIYLAPHCYHRVHIPVSGNLLSVRHIPGQLWPVNSLFTPIVPRIFTRNERLVFEVALEEEGKVYVAMIGAFNVGRIATADDLGVDLVTNDFNRQFRPVPSFWPLSQHKQMAAGDELGTFMLGSTVVIVLDEKARRQFELMQVSQKSPILMGSNIAKAAVQ